MTNLCVAGLLEYKLLSKELIHNVGKVGHDEDYDQHHGEVGCLYPVSAFYGGVYLYKKK